MPSFVFWYENFNKKHMVDTKLPQIKQLIPIILYIFIVSFNQY